MCVCVCVYIRESNLRNNITSFNYLNYSVIVDVNHL